MLEIHRHWVVMVMPLLGLTLGLTLQIWALFVGPINLIWWHPDGFVFLWLPGFAIGTTAMFRAIAEYRDRFMVTTVRLGWFHGVLSTQDAWMPVQRVVDTTVLRPWLGRWINYGHFKFENAAQIQGLYKIAYVRNIDEVREILMNLVIAGELPAPKQLAGDGS